MCEVNWMLLLEYVKVLLGWPPIALVIALFFFWLFRPAIQGLLNRVVEGNLLGQSFKATPHVEQQRESVGVGSDPLMQAAEQLNNVQPAQVTLPPELQNDPQAQAAIAYVQANPAQTVIEYKRLLFNYNSERLYGAIYGTQVALLEFLANRPTEPATLPELTQFHTVHQTRVGRTEYQLRDYIGFLVSFGVISPEGPTDNQRYRITQHGVEFLSYIKATYPVAWNQRAF